VQYKNTKAIQMVSNGVSKVLKSHLYLTPQKRRKTRKRKQQ